MGSVHLGLTMKFFALAFFVAAASAKDIRFNVLAPPTELEYGFCDGSPTPLTFDVMSVAPFPIMVPCLDIEGLHIGSCHYDGDELLSTASDFLCPTYVPEGQACALPLGPGTYGGGDPLVLGPIESIPDILLPFLKGTVRAEATVTDAAGATVACVFVRAAVDH